MKERNTNGKVIYIKDTIVVNASCARILWQHTHTEETIGCT